MAISDSDRIVVVSSSNELLGTPLLAPEGDAGFVPGAVDYKHRPAIRSKHGRWRSAAYIIGVEIAERMAYFGIAGNLINFLTGRLGQSTAMAAANVNAWGGVSGLLPILGAVIADSILGRFCTIIASSLIYILGLGLLTLSAMLPSLSCLNQERSISGVLKCSSDLQRNMFFAALYLVALGQAGHRPCVQAFGADQFCGEDPAESEAKSSFFNWWHFGLTTGMMLGIGVLSYIQENLSWGLGFGIPCIIMATALVIFLCGTPTYRYNKQGKGQSPFVRIGRVFVLAARNRYSTCYALQDKQDAPTTIQSYRESQQLLDKALLEPDISKAGAACSMNDVEEAKAILRLFPIWATNLVFAVFLSPISTFFTKQGVTLDRSIGPSFTIPAASLQSFAFICVVLVIPIYDRLFVPVARILTGKPRGISMLQRIGIGLFMSIVCMVVAAVVEKRRLQTALQHGLIDLPNVTIPMRIWWLLPQYALSGIAEAFALVGLQEFFYNQVPNELRSMGLALYLSVLGTGSLLSSILVTLINKATSGGTSWFSDNLNQAHLDYYYWLLAGLNAIGLVLFIYFAKSYIYTNNKVPA